MSLVDSPPAQAEAIGRPLRVQFLLTSMPVGGAETLVVNLIRRFDRRVIEPELVCLKQPGPLGEMMSAEVPVHSSLIRHKWDVAVLGRLARLFRRRRVDAVITVGAGDKMFWGRLAAYRVGVPVVMCAIHSTGWPDSIGRLNRSLTSITDGFIAVAPKHAEYLRDGEGFPAAKVFMIPNGVDTTQFDFDPTARAAVRRELGIGTDAPVIGIVAALRPEKDHELFLQAASQLLQHLPQARFLVVGDGPERPGLTELAARLDIEQQTLFLGSRSDIPQLLSACDLFALTSRNEANPVSILEAMACCRPVVAPDVGSIAEMVRDGLTGQLFSSRDPEQIAGLWRGVVQDPQLSRVDGFRRPRLCHPFRVARSHGRAIPKTNCRNLPTQTHRGATQWQLHSWQLI